MSGPDLHVFTLKYLALKMWFFHVFWTKKKIQKFLPEIQDFEILAFSAISGLLSKFQKWSDFDETWHKCQLDLEGLITGQIGASKAMLRL